MRIVTRYQSEDGVLWETESAAQARDHLVYRCQTIGQRLGPRPGDHDFRNGHRFITHDPQAVLEFKRECCLLAYEQGVIREDVWLHYQEIGPRSGYARAIHEGPEPLSRLWERWCCCDQQGREWGQVAFALAVDAASALA